MSGIGKRENPNFISLYRNEISYGMYETSSKQSRAFSYSLEHNFPW